MHRRCELVSVVEQTAWPVPREAVTALVPAVCPGRRGDSPRGTIFSWSERSEQVEHRGELLLHPMRMEDASRASGCGVLTTYLGTFVDGTALMPFAAFC